MTDANHDREEMAEENQGEGAPSRTPDLEQQLLRAQADLQNLTRQQERERRELPERGMERCLEGLMPLMDNLMRAKNSAPADLDPWGQGVLSLLSLAQTQLEEMGVRVISQTGIPSDPHHHEVLSVDETQPEGLVSQIVEVGYLLPSGRLLRAAKVIVGGKREEG